jgi:hypothetical protein
VTSVLARPPASLLASTMRCEVCFCTGVSSTPRVARARAHKLVQSLRRAKTAASSASDERT